MDGFEVLPLERAAEIGDLFCTATGDKHVIAREHMERMKDGAILANTGHFNVEIEIPALRELAVETRQAREFVEEFTLADGRRLYLIADGRLVNLAAAEGHPALVMDMSFANQALALEYAAQHASELDRKVYRCRRRSTRRSRASSSRRWASRSTSSPRSRRTTSPRGTRAPESDRRKSFGWRRTARRSSSSTSAGCRGGRRGSLRDGGGGRRGDPLAWLSAARRRSGLRPPTASPSRPAGRRSRECRARCSRPARPTAVNLPWALAAAAATARLPMRSPRSIAQDLDGNLRMGAAMPPPSSVRHARAHALQCGRPCDRRLRLGLGRAPCRVEGGLLGASSWTRRGRSSRARASPRGSSRDRIAHAVITDNMAGTLFPSSQLQSR